jgi:hypothetical protein
MKLVTRTCEALFVLVTVFLIGFSLHIDKSRPNHPVGQFTIRTENHGEAVYISRTDRVVTDWAWIGTFVLGVICLGLEKASSDS